MPHLESLANWVSGWIDRHKNGAVIIVGLVAGLSFLMVTGGGLIIALASLTGAAASASAALQMMRLKLGGRGLGGAVGGKGKGGKLSKLVKGGGVLVALSGLLTMFSSWSDDKKTTGEKLDDTAEVAGGLGGMWALAALGASAGTAVPVIGTAIGGLVGGALGYWGGSALGDWLGDFFKNSEAKEIANQSLAPATAKGRVPVNASQKQVNVTNHFTMTATGSSDPKQFIVDAMQQAQHATAEIMTDVDPIWG